MLRSDFVEPHSLRSGVGKPRLSPGPHHPPRILRSRTSLRGGLLAKVIDPRSLRPRCHAIVLRCARLAYARSPGGPQSFGSVDGTIMACAYLQPNLVLI